MPMPADANIHGDVFGGWIMSKRTSPARSRRRAAPRAAWPRWRSTPSSSEPVFVGDLLSFYAAIVKTGNTSITVSVEVYAERQRLDAEVVKVTEAVLTYVATDEAPPQPPPTQTLSRNA